MLLLDSRDLSASDFSSARLSSSTFIGARLTEAKFPGAEISLAKLDGADLGRELRKKAVGMRASFTGANLAKARLVSADFSRASFVRAVLTGANLVKSEMNRSTSREPNFQAPIYRRAELPRAWSSRTRKCPECQPQLFQSRRSDLRGVALAEVDLTGAYLFLTQIAGSDVRASRG